MTVRGALDAVARCGRAVIRRIQAVVMWVCLLLVYFVGIGATLLLAWVFDRRLLRGTPAGQPSFWVAAEGYDADPEQASRQS